jgi:hypothetical protein
MVPRIVLRKEGIGGIGGMFRLTLRKCPLPLPAYQVEQPNYPYHPPFRRDRAIENGANRPPQRGSAVRRSRAGDADVTTDSDKPPTLTLAAMERISKLGAADAVKMQTRAINMS